MRIFGLPLLLFILLTSCQKTKMESFDLNTLPTDWVRLTEKNGKLVVFNSCDAGNLLLTISGSGEKLELLLHGEQEDSEFLLLGSSQRNDTIFIDAKWKDSGLKQPFQFIWTDKKKGMGRWITTYSNGFTSNTIFVVSNRQTDFEKVDQPCVECWGDECDEMEKDMARTDKPIVAIKRVFDDYVKYEESTDSQDNKTVMTNSLKSLDTVTNPDDLEILINVWMYYDPTDFPDIPEIDRILKTSKPQSIEAVKKRIANKKEWESDESAPYSDLKNLLKQLEDE